MGNFGDYPLALGMRDAITSLVTQEVGKFRPAPRYAIVDSIDRLYGRCGVIFNGETNPVYVHNTGLWPVVTGQTVRVEGIGTDKYITGVVGATGNPVMYDLGVVDLNNIVESGVYSQRRNADAVAGANYPVITAGFLEVFNAYRGGPGNNNFIYQRYTAYGAGSRPSEVWTRGYYNTAWGPWLKGLTASDAGVPWATAAGSVNVTATNAIGATIAIAYPANRFTRAPVVSLTKANASLPRFSPYTTGHTAAGMTLGIYAGDGVANTGTVTLHWTARQMSEASSGG